MKVFLRRVLSTKVESWFEAVKRGEQKALAFYASRSQLLFIAYVLQTSRSRDFPLMQLDQFDIRCTLNILMLSTSLVTIIERVHSNKTPCPDISQHACSEPILKSSRQGSH
jgi:hypothetical protein